MAVECTARVPKSPPPSRGRVRERGRTALAENELRNGKNEAMSVNPFPPSTAPPSRPRSRPRRKSASSSSTARWGTQIQSLKLSEDDFRGARFKDWGHDLKGNNDLLVLTQPDAIREIHLNYFRAGADIVETNTFSSTAIAQADYGMEALAYELNVESARLAREAAAIAEKADGRPRFVAGAIGPTNRTLSISPDVNNPGFRAVSFDQVRDGYAEQTRGLIDGGSQIILIETIFDTLNAKAAIAAVELVFAEKGVRLPVMISGTITDLSGRTLSGQTTEAFWYSVRHADRCRSASTARWARARCAPTSPTSAASPTRSSAPIRTPACPMNSASMTSVPKRPRACWPSSRIQASSTSSAAAAAPRPTTSAPLPRPWPARPRKRRAQDHDAPVRPEPFRLEENIRFVNVGERTNVTGSAKFRKLIKEGDYAAALDVARDQVANGAQVIDVNMDEGLLDSEKAMVEFLNLVASEPDIARVPIMVDSSKFHVIEAGLKTIQGKPSSTRSR